MTGSAVARIPVVGVLRTGTLAQGPPLVAVDLLTPSQPLAGTSPSEYVVLNTKIRVDYKDEASP
jgi:hypothetical protein